MDRRRRLEMQVEVVRRRKRIKLLHDMINTHSYTHTKIDTYILHMINIMMIDADFARLTLKA